MVNLPSSYLLLLICILNYLQHLRSLRAYFHRGGVDEELLNTDLFNEVHQNLQLNCMTTEELMLQFYNSLSESVVRHS